MYRLTDNELIEELQDRLDTNKRALHDLRIVTQKLSEVNKRLQESEQLKSNFLSNIRNESIDFHENRGKAVPMPTASGRRTGGIWTDRERRKGLDYAPLEPRMKVSGVATRSLHSRPGLSTSSGPFPFLGPANRNPVCAIFGSGLSPRSSFGCLGAAGLWRHSGVTENDFFRRRSNF